MALKSNYDRMNYSLETEDLTQIEFSERWGTGTETNNSDKQKKSQKGGFNSDIDYLFTSEEKSQNKYKKTKQLGGVINTDESNEDYLRHKKQQGGNDSDYIDENYLKKKKHHKKQQGGSRSDQSDDEDIDYLFTQTKKQSGGADTEGAIERDFLAVFNTAKEYSKRIEKISGGDAKTVDVFISESPEMNGGGYESDGNFTDRYDDMISTPVGHTDIYGGGTKADNTKRLKGVIEFAGKLRDNHPELAKQNISWTGIVSIAWMIWKEAEKKTGSDKINVNEAKALELSDKLSDYIKQYKALPPKVKKAKKAKKEKNIATPSRVYGGFY